MASSRSLIRGRRPSPILASPHPVSSAERISDEFTALLCRGLGAAHRSGDKTAWWWQIGVDPTKWP
jgi:hypothetical protein